MRKSTAFVLFLIVQICSFAQDAEEINQKNDSIVQEGKTLYRSEMASWYGTDIFLELFKEHDKIGGYVSYHTPAAATCIFFSKDDKPKVIGTIQFDSTFNLKKASADLTEREPTSMEFDLFRTRKKAQEIINSDSFFVHYQNTGLNLIPIVYNGTRKVYVLTGPKKNGTVILGNDYLLTFNDNIELLSKKRLHKNIISIDYLQKGEEGSKSVGAVHTHLPETGDCMTVTDVCTLMLYQKFAGWEQHTVVSENYYSFWNCKTNSLVSITKDAMDKINADQDNRHPQKDD